jgi:hypothetical protein
MPSKCNYEFWEDRKTIWLAVSVDAGFGELVCVPIIRNRPAEPWAFSGAGWWADCGRAVRIFAGRSASVDRFWNAGQLAA